MRDQDWLFVNLKDHLNLFIIIKVSELNRAGSYGSDNSNPNEEFELSIMKGLLMAPTPITHCAQTCGPLVPQHAGLKKLWM